MNKDELTLVAITPDDIEELTSLSQLTFRAAFASFNTEGNMQKYLATYLTKERLLQEVKNPESQYYFAAINGRNIGYIKLNSGNAQTDLFEDNGVEIERIYVLAEYQGMMIGQWLLKQIFAMVNRLQKKYVWLGVWEKNEGAIRFYQRNGFVQFSEHSFMLGDDKQTDLLLKYKLTSG